MKTLGKEVDLVIMDYADIMKDTSNAREVRHQLGSIYEDLRGTAGEIEVPTAMDKTETTIIAAALETIERVGPTDTEITIEEIEDVRGSKREYILERAKRLMEKFGESEKGLDEFNEEISKWEA